MVGCYYEVYSIIKLLQAPVENAHKAVQLLYHCFALFSYRSIVVGCPVGLVKIDHKQAWSLALRQFCYAQRFFHSLRIGETGLVVPAEVVIGIKTLNGHIRANPVDACALYALLLCCYPYWLAAKVVGIVAGCAISHREEFSLLRRPELAVYYAVVVWYKPCCKGKVVGEGGGGVGGNHCCRHSVCCNAVQPRSIVYGWIVPSEGIQRDHYCKISLLLTLSTAGVYCNCKCNEAES